ncbi:MAG: VCBS repeat-containing protein [Gammaproteobacteria bacterium]|nr:VCBS repeat-containing protein [Gammaproteobacteria bacterium]
MAALALLLAMPALGQAPHPIPHSTVVRGNRDIATAWLAEPTRRYAHGVLGDDIEAAAIRVQNRDGIRYSLQLADDSVFEDLTPRLADIDGDGRDEIWTVRSDAVAGARLEAYVLVDGVLRRRFATPPIGSGYRWLNPVGVADFDGDGHREAAYVQTPHIGGILTVVRPHGRQLVVVARLRGYSNHVMGSTRLDLAAIADLDRNGGADIVLPDQGRTRLVVISLAGGVLIERWRGEPGPPVGGSLTLERSPAGWLARYLTLDDAVITIEIPVTALRPLT